MRHTVLVPMSLEARVFDRLNGRQSPLVHFILQCALSKINVPITIKRVVFFFLRASIGGEAYVSVFSSSVTWAAIVRLRGLRVVVK